MRDEKIDFERVTCMVCQHVWTSSHSAGLLMIECPSCECETPILSDPDEIARIEATVKPKLGRTTAKKKL